ncbi:hypothetical protein M9H77_19225 [Catharanthus roseus]|uniref:Uncharacterized protein n=1 Tax=Catharanthus roseus TaxID=4058 RepID=A0ACC0B9S8_CATRO|nr:hypothetical protein M9H77_19225 [Catharanthus roseus]
MMVNNFDHWACDELGKLFGIPTFPLLFSAKDSISATSMLLLSSSTVTGRRTAAVLSQPWTPRPPIACPLFGLPIPVARFYECSIPESASTSSNYRGPIVWPRARRGDDDLGPVTDRTGRVEGRAVTVSSRGVKGTPQYIRHTIHFCTYWTGSDTIFSRTHIPLNEVSGPGLQLGAQFFQQLAGWEHTGPADGGPPDPVLVTSYNGHVAGSIWHRGILKSRSRYVSLTGWTPSDPAVGQLTGETGL